MWHPDTVPDQVDGFIQFCYCQASCQFIFRFGVVQQHFGIAEDEEIQITLIGVELSKITGTSLDVPVSCGGSGGTNGRQIYC